MVTSIDRHDEADVFVGLDVGKRRTPHQQRTARCYWACTSTLYQPPTRQVAA